MPAEPPGARFDAAPWLALLVAAIVASCGGSDGTGPTTDPPTITTDALADGTVDEPYSEGVNATGGAGEYTWDVLSGSLPTGLETSVEDLDDGDLLIVGVPETAGDFDFQLRVRDSEGGADTAAFTITISPPPASLTIATHKIPPGLAGSPYEVELKAEAEGGGGNFQWSVVEGSLPAGLTLGDDGQFAGSPTSPDSATFTVEVTSGGLSATQAYTLVIVGENTGRYDITPFPVVDVPAELEDNVAEAIRRWEAALTGNLSKAMIPAGHFDDRVCAGFGPLLNGTTVDDIIVMVNIDSIDGPGGVLGRAGPCVIRPSNVLPVAGLLTLDEVDLLEFSSEQATDIIQHEIGHVLGFGTLWTDEQFELLDGAGTSDPRYLGEEAIAEYQAAGGTDEAIPVENQGGEGTRDGHWRESVFGNELMTGFSNADNYLSRMSIASFGDLGYQIDLSAADDEGAILAQRIAADGAGQSADLEIIGYDIVGVGPIVVLHPDGTSTPLNPDQRRDP